MFTAESVPSARLLSLFKSEKPPRFTKLMPQQFSIITPGAQSGVQGKASINAFMCPWPWLVTDFFPSQAFETCTDGAGQPRDLGRPRLKAKLVSFEKPMPNSHHSGRGKKAKIPMMTWSTVRPDAWGTVINLVLGKRRQGQAQSEKSLPERGLPRTLFSKASAKPEG